MIVSMTLTGSIPTGRVDLWIHHVVSEGHNVHVVDGFHVKFCLLKIIEVVSVNLRIPRCVKRRSYPGQDNLKDVNTLGLQF